MNTAFTRLMWKEFRAQRMLSIVLLAGWLVLHLLVLFNGKSVLDLTPPIVMIPILFIVAAAVIAFAGEEDEKTSNFLRMLPCRTPTLMSAKLSAIISGCLALCISMLVLSVVLELVVSTTITVFALFVGRPVDFTFPAFRPQPHDVSLHHGEQMYFAAFVTLAFAASVFASMMTRKALSAVGLTAATLSGIMITAWILASEASRRQQGGTLAPWHEGIATILIAISTALLARPWHLGHLPLRWPTSRFAGNSVIRGIPSFSGLWQRWLRRIAAQPLTMSRTLTTLTWRECRSAVPFAMTWLTIGIMICAGRYFSSAFYPWPFLFLFVFVHECGQRTMREDQRTGSISLLANIGVHPLQVWISKTFVWLFVVCIVGIAVIAIDNCNFEPGISKPTPALPGRVSDIVDAIRVPQWGQRPDSQKPPSTSADHWLQLSVCFAVTLGLFSLGQLTASWIRNQIIAFAASLIAVFASALLFNLVIFGDWPAWVTLVPIPFCLLFATAATARHWIDRRETWRLRLDQLALLVIPFVVFPILGSYGRQWQPQLALSSLSKETGIAIRLADNLPNTNISPEMASLLAMAKTPSENWRDLDKPADTKCWYEFATALERFPLHQMAIPQGGYRGDRIANYREPLLLSNAIYLEKGPEIIRELLQPFDDVLAKTNAFPPLPIAWTAPWSNTPTVPLSLLLLENARHREADGDIAGAVNQIVRAIRVTKSQAMQTSSWANWLACLDAERVALGRLRILLGTADLSSSDLESLLAELKSVVAIQWQDPRMMLQRRTLFWSDVMLRGPFVMELATLPPVQQDFEIEEISLRIQKTWRVLKGSEALRACDTMMFSKSLLVSKYNSMAIDGKAQFLAQLQAERIQQLKRFIATSHFADLDVDIQAAGSETESATLNPQIDTIASERATLLTIMLQKYRIAHGKFPESLLELPDSGPLDDLIRTDPWTGSEFFYGPPGHTPPFRLGLSGDETPVVFGQPVLFTPGALQARLKSYDGLTIVKDSFEMYKLPENLIPFLGLSDVVDLRYEQISSKVTVDVRVDNFEIMTDPTTPSQD